MEMKGVTSAFIIFIGFLVLGILVMIMLFLWFSGFLDIQSVNVVKILTDGLSNLFKSISGAGRIGI